MRRYGVRSTEARKVGSHELVGEKSGGQGIEMASKGACTDMYNRDANTPRFSVVQRDRHSKLSLIRQDQPPVHEFPRGYVPPLDMGGI